MAPTEREKMMQGKLFHAFVPDLVASRARCKHACTRFNNAGEVPRRRLIELWRDINGDPTPLPLVDPDPEKDDALFSSEPWIEPGLHIDYGTNVRLGSGCFINFNCTILDTCVVSIGARTLVGPNVSFYSGTHPLDPAVRQGTEGPELGKEVTIEDDCWIGGNALILPGVTVGKGSTIGAGSVVTRSIPPFSVAAGNPARVIRKVITSMDPEQVTGMGNANGDLKRGISDAAEGAEVPMKEDAE